jgi:hypothetical protein
MCEVDVLEIKGANTEEDTEQREFDAEVPVTI